MSDISSPTYVYLLNEVERWEGHDELSAHLTPQGARQAGVERAAEYLRENPDRTQGHLAGEWAQDEHQEWKLPLQIDAEDGVVVLQHYLTIKALELKP